MAMLMLQCYWGIFFGVLFHGVHGLTRTICTREAQFDNPKQGYSLDGNVLATVSVQNTADCVVECLQHPVCQSINYHESANPEHLCELNSKTHNDVTLTANGDVTYYGPTASQPNCTADGPGECKNGGVCAMSCHDQTLICHCPEGRTGPTCEGKSVIHKNQDFAMVYPTRSVEDYISVQDSHGQDFSNITLLLWLYTLESERMTIFDYVTIATDENVVRQFAIVYEIEKLVVHVQSGTGGNIKEFIIPPVNDGYWHHVGVAWSLGKYSIYLDGVSVYSGNDLGTDTPVQAGGKFVIGQGSIGDDSFLSERSFRGKVSQVNLWDEILTAEEIQWISKSCYNNVGTILDWSSVLENTNGNAHKEDPNSCQSLRQNEEYDIAISAASAQTSHIVSSHVPDLEAFTLSTWAKHSEYIRYVDYTSDGATLLAFRLHKDILILEIAGANPKQARVPRYWKESPAYWHHLATTWSSATAKWRIYLDGSLVSIMHDVAASITIPAGGQLLLGLGNPDNGDVSMNGSLSRLNMWDYEVDGHAISLMANKGPLLENGNVFAWYGVKSNIVGDMNFENTPSDVYNSRAMADFQMSFPEASSQNYAVLHGVFPNDLTILSACFWFNFLRYDAGLFAYSSSLSEEEFNAFLLHSGYDLNFRIGGVSAGITATEVRTGRWHFFCIMWKSSDGLLEVYQDGVHLQSKTVSVGRVMPGRGALVIGQEPDSYAGGFSSSQAMKGELAGLNFWTELLTLNEISGMAGGTININGDLLQWRDFRGALHGAVSIKENSDFEFPEYRVQKLRDDWCETNYPGTYARFIHNSASYAWRCARPSAMLDENMVYDIIGNSPSFFSKTTALLAIT